MAKGIETEAEALYFLAQVRKILEGNTESYEYLKFHCDWTLHAVLTGKMAQEILKKFNAANSELKLGKSLEELQTPLGQEIQEIFGMIKFEQELVDFLKEHSLHSLGNQWPKFLFLYTSIIKDCPLEIYNANTTADVQKVTVNLELSNEPTDGWRCYKISWIINDKNGLQGELFVINSFQEA